MLIVRHLVLLALACFFATGPVRAAVEWSYVRPGTEPNMGDWIRDILGIEGFGKSYAVIVGINEFRYFDSLDATANDPDRVFRFLRDEMKFDRILMLRNRDVTYDRLRTLFEHELPQVIRPEDRFLFYWSGHGTQFKNARGVELGYLPLVDSPRDNKARMVSMRDLSRWDGELPARHALFLLDACFSGLAGSTVQSDIRGLKLRDLARPGHHIISAGGKDQQTIASRQEWQGSIFTHALLNALGGDADRFGGSGGSGDGVITLHELIESIADAVEQAKAEVGWRRPLRPVLNKFHGEGQFFFLTNYQIESGSSRLVSDEGITPRDLQFQGTSLTFQARESDLDLSRNERRLIQVGLNALGHEAGGIDGIFGSRTRGAIRSYQVASNAEATGYLTPDQAKALIATGEGSMGQSLPVEPKDTQGSFGFNSERPGAVIKDCKTCPEMVVVPAGRFNMGSPETEDGRDQDEGPQHWVDMPAFAIGKHEITRGQFAQFVRATGHETGDSCWSYEGEEWKESSDRGWQGPGFKQTDVHPIVCIDWDDAKAYSEWLSRKTRQWYRLPSESEWEYAARAMTTTSRYWGDDPDEACDYANGADLMKKKMRDGRAVANCDDRHATTAPVASYKANGFGLHDSMGNVSEWVEDCWQDNYDDAPSDNSAWLGGECRFRVVRGGSWDDLPEFLRSASRYRNQPDFRYHYLGFRVARTLSR